MQALKAAVAALVAHEARMHDLVDPEKVIGDATRAVVKETAAAVVAIGEAVQQLEQDVATIEQHPALSVPALDAAPVAAEELAPNTPPASTTDSGPASSPAPEGGGEASST